MWPTTSGLSTSGSSSSRPSQKYGSEHRRSRSSSSNADFPRSSRSSNDVWSPQLREHREEHNLDRMPHCVTSAIASVFREPDALESSMDGLNINSKDEAANVEKQENKVLYLGDLEAWMQNVEYIAYCCRAMRWTRNLTDDRDMKPVDIEVKIMKGSSPGAPGYCFLTFPTGTQATAVMKLFESQQQRTLMPSSDRIFKLNWSTGVAGTQAVFDKEYSIFVRDLPKDVTEGELVALFASKFRSTRSAKLMTDPVTGISKTYGFVRFGEMGDCNKALALEKAAPEDKLLLRGRVIRISEASPSGAFGTGGSRSREGSVGSFPRPNYKRSPSDQTPFLQNPLANPLDKFTTYKPIYNYTAQPIYETTGSEGFSRSPTAAESQQPASLRSGASTYVPRSPPSESMPRALPIPIESFEVRKYGPASTQRSATYSFENFEPFASAPPAPTRTSQTGRTSDYTANGPRQQAYIPPPARNRAQNPYLQQFQ